MGNYWRAARHSATRAKSATCSCSPRTVGSTPAASSASSAAAADPAIAASADAHHLAPLPERRIDDREDLGSRSRSSPVGSRRRHRDQTGVDVRGGPEDGAADQAGAPHVGVPGRLDAGHAVDLRARAGGQPLGDLELHHDEDPLDASGSVASSCRSTGTATLYGRLATSAVGAGPGGRRAAARRPPPPGGARRASGANSATVSGRAAASTGSISTAVTWWPRSSRASVSEPRPGPTSSTTSSSAELGGSHDPPHRVGVDDEVLATLLGRADVVPVAPADEHPPAREVSDRRMRMMLGSRAR